MATFSGTEGDDSLVGTDSGDTFFFSFGDDTLVGGGGQDIIVTSVEGNLFGETVVLDLALGTLLITDQGLMQSYQGIESFFIEDSYSVTLRGDDQDNTLEMRASPSDGVIEGRAGDDRLVMQRASGSMSGGAGNDTMVLLVNDVEEFPANSGETTVEGGDGSDLLVIGANINDITINSFDDAAYTITWQAPRTSEQTFETTQRVTLLDEIEAISFIGFYPAQTDAVTLTFAQLFPLFPPPQVLDDAFDMMEIVDKIVGTYEGEVITGTSLRDKIQGREGKDWITPGTGEGEADGGAGIDMLSYADLGTMGVDVNLAMFVADLNNGDQQGVRNFENLTGTSAARPLTAKVSSPIPPDIVPSVPSINSASSPARPYSAPLSPYIKNVLFCASPNSDVLPVS